MSKTRSLTPATIQQHSSEFRLSLTKKAMGIGEQ
jgi:hypothetical protein